MDILIEKQYRNYNYLSRYTSFPFYYHTLDKKYVYGMTAQLSQNSAYSLHKIKAGETWDSIALDYYNNPTFFWCLMDFNQVQDPYKDLEIGQSIKIPTLNNISFKEN